MNCLKDAVPLLLAVLSLLPFGCPADDKLGIFAKTNCPVKVPEELVKSGKFSFGYMKVPEFHRKPKGRNITLALAVFKCRSDSATREPLILVTGGPGMSNIAGFVPLISGDLGKLLLNNRDVVIIELRGLKYSEPYLICPEIDKLKLDLLDKHLTAEQTVGLYLKSLKSAYNRFKRAGVNLSAYNNNEIAHDIVYVMEKLGHRKFSIFGTSFGTTVVQTLLLKHSDRVVSAVLNGVVDLNRGFANMHINSVHTLDAIFERCQSNPEAKEAYPDLKRRFLALLKKLNEQPATLTTKNPETGQKQVIVFNGDKLAVWVFAQMYYNAQIPLTLHNILSGDYSEIVNNPGFLFPLPDFSNGLSLSIIISQYSNYNKETIPRSGEYADYVKGCGTIIFTPYFLSQAKQVWKVADLTKEDRSLRAEVPTLMLCGELDHVCPPGDAAELSKRLTKSYRFVFPGVAHSPIEAGMCGISMMKEFIDDPSKPPNSECIKQFQSGFKLPP